MVDTNVLVVANRQNGESYSCANSCVQALLGIRASGVLLVDAAGEILTEYRQYCSHAGQPGFGDGFFKWVIDNKGRRDLILAVPITPKPGFPNDLLEFPDHPGLGEFDRSDRKFVAVANTHPGKAPILQATDSKWWGWKDALKDCGITVEFLCPDEIQLAYQRKFSR